MAKRLFIAFFFASPLLADINPNPVVVNIGSPFAGLNNQDNSLIIPPSNAQDLLNVDITPGGVSVKKRHGYGLDATLSVSTSAVHNGYHFFDANGNDIRLWMNDTNISASKNSGTYSAVVTSWTVNGTMQCTDSQGLAWCVSTNNDQVIRTDGTSAGTTFFPNHPKGTLITAGPDRLAIANVSGAQNSIYFSASGDFTNETAGSQPSSPFVESILAPGSHLTHLKYFNGRYLWWKDQSFGYVIMQDQFNLNVVIVSALVGTYDNADVDNQGIVYFRGTDNHIWQYDGANLERLTREISPIITAANKRKSNFWTQKTQSDFNSGSYSSTTYDASQSAVVLVTNDPADNSFEFDSINSGAYWKPFGGGSWAPSTVQNGVNCTISPKDQSFFADYTVFAYGPTMNVQVINTTSTVVIASTVAVFSPNFCTWHKETITGLSGYANTSVQIKLQDQTTPANYLLSTAFILNGNNINFYHASDDIGGGHEMAFDLFSGAVSTFVATGIYYSAVNNAPNLTSWNTFNATSQNNGGTHTFYVRSSTTIFTVTGATPTWVAQTVGGVVAASTGTYFQMSDTFTITASSQNPILQNFTFNWFEGNAADQAYGTYFDFGIWWSISYSTSATTNNRILRYDLLNNTWTIYDIAANGFLVQNNLLYFGDPVNGKVYVFASGNESDNGTAINAYWKSKDFTTGGGGSILTGYQPYDTPFNEKDYRSLSAFLKAQTTGTLTETWTVDLTTSTSETIQMADPSALNIVRHNFRLPSTRATSFNVKYGNNASNQPFELFGASFSYVPIPWRPYP